MCSNLSPRIRMEISRPWGKTMGDNQTAFRAVLIFAERPSQRGTAVICYYIQLRETGIQTQWITNNTTPIGATLPIILLAS